MDIQRIRVKLYADAPADADVAPLLDIFSRWRTDTAHPAGWIDLADYAHVPEGPLAMLVGRQGNLVYDLEDGRPGLVWKNKAGLGGDAESRLIETLVRALETFEALAAEESFPRSIVLRTDRLAVDFPDRVNVPRADETESVLGTAVRGALDKLYGPGRWQAQRLPDTGRALGWDVQAQTAPALDELVSRLAGPSRPSVTEDAQDMPPQRVSVEEAARLVREEGYVYLDVRSLGEFAAGHPEGAYSLPILIEASGGYGLAPNASFLEVAKANFQPDSRIVVGCRTSNRSDRAQEILQAAGFQNVVVNAGGFVGAGPEMGWARAGLPVSQEPESGRSYEELRAKPQK